MIVRRGKGRKFKSLYYDDGSGIIGWYCPSCEVLNQILYSICRVCGEPRPECFKHDIDILMQIMEVRIGNRRRQ